MANVRSSQCFQVMVGRGHWILWMLLLVIPSPLRLDVAHKEDLIVLGAWYRAKLPSAVKQAQLLLFTTGPTSKPVSRTKLTLTVGLETASVGVYQLL